MPWYIFSFIALFSGSFFALSVKWALNLNWRKEKLLLYIFIGYFIGYFFWNWGNFSFIFAPERIWVYILWGLLAALFSIYGNYLSAKAVEKVPNPGYTEAIKASSAILTLFLSFFLFQSTITWMKLAGVVIIPLGLLPVLSQKTKGGSGWQQPALISALFFVAMFMVFKQMTNLGFSSVQILLILSFFAVIGYLLVDYFANKSQKTFEKPSYVPIILAILVGLVANFANVTALKLAPNVGYAQAIANSQAFLTLLFARQLFPKEKGGEFDFRKWLGVLVVIAGVILIALGK